MAGGGKLKRLREQSSFAPAGNGGSHDAAVQPNESDHAEQPAAKRARVETIRTLFIRSLPSTATEETLTDFFSQHYPVKHATVIRDPKTKESRGYGFVTFADPDDAKEAKEKLNHQKLDGRSISIDLAEARQRKVPGGSAEINTQKAQREAALLEARKPPKLIIRNLPWSIRTSDQLGDLFRSFGKVKYADLPQNKGKLKGFGFVTIRGHKNAENAVETLNGKVVDGRTIAVDWAVEKGEWEKQQKADTAAGPGSGETEKEVDAEDDNDREEEHEEEDEDLRNFMKNYMDNLEDEDSHPDKEGDSDDEGNGDEEVPPKKPTMNNNSTLFIRNLPFSTTDADLKAHFEQFGGVLYARVVMDRATDRPAGTGFVCFFSEQDSRACLKGAPHPRASDPRGKQSILQDELADAEGRYTLDGRLLQVSQAVSKDEAARLAADGAASRGDKLKDKRRLYLLSEGTIPRGSPLHALLTPSEVKTRDESLAQRKKLIQSNPSLHLSLTRLAVRNIPRNIDSKELKALAREAVVEFAKDVKENRRQPLSKEEIARGGTEDKEAEHKRKEKGKGVVKQTKIVFENKEGSKVSEGDGAGRSRGYGFIEYSSHRWALMGLRWLNGHALKNAAGKAQRLIVEFAIENAQVVARRKDQQSKSGRGPKDASDIAKRPAAKYAPQYTRPGKMDQGSGKGRAGEEDARAEDSKASKSATKDNLQRRIISRKRMAKKRKAKARYGN